MQRNKRKKIANDIIEGKSLFAYPRSTFHEKCHLLSIVIYLDLISTPGLKLSSLYFCSRPCLSAFPLKA